MVNSTINIKSENGDLVRNSTVFASSPTLSSGSTNISMHISDTSQNIEDATLNIRPDSMQLILYGNEEYFKKASLYFGSLFSGGLNAEVLWYLLGLPTNEQINSSHIVDALAPINLSITNIINDFDDHIDNWSIHLSAADRDFFERLKVLYGQAYDIQLDYLILTNPYEFNNVVLQSGQIGLFAGYGGFSAYSGVVDAEIPFYDLVQGTIPTKSGGEPTSEAYFAYDNTYGYGITTLNIPTTEPEDLTDGEIALYAGQGGFTSHSSGDDDTELVIGYYYEGDFYLDDEYTLIAPKEPTLLYIDLLENKIYRYDGEEDEFILLTTDAELIEGYYKEADGLFYESLESGVYSDVIEGKDKAIYLSLDTNILYRYDVENDEYVQLSALADFVLVKGYLNTIDGKFYEDTLFTTEIIPDATHLYCDLNTFKIYYYNSTASAYDRWHHKVDLDYILFNTQFSANNLSPAQDTAALYYGAGGFDSHSFSGYRQYYGGDGIIVDQNTDTISANLGFINTGTKYAVEADSTTKKLYVNVPSTGGQGVTDHSLLTNRFSQNYSGQQNLWQHDIDVIDGLRSILNSHTSSISSHTSSISSLEEKADYGATKPIVITENNNPTTGQYHYTFGLSQLDTNTSNIEDSTSGTILASYTYIDEDSSTHNRKITTETLPFNVSAVAKSIAKRTSDSAIAASYFKLTNYLNSTQSAAVSPAQSEAAVFIGNGGFDSHSFSGYREYTAGDGIDISINDVLSVKLNYQTDSVNNNYGVRYGTGGLYVNVPVQSGPSGTTDHNSLTHRFSTEYTSANEAIVYQHDIDIISGLRPALDSVASSTWSATAPVLFSHTDSPSYTNVISLEPFVSKIPSTTVDNVETYTVENLASGYLMSTATTYEEDVNETIEGQTVKVRRLTKIPVAYSNAITNSTIVKRMSDGALAATYMLIRDYVDNAQSAVLPGQNESAVYIGAGGFNSFADDTYYDIIKTWPSVAPAQNADEVLSAYLVYDKITWLMNHGGGGQGVQYYAGNGIDISASDYISAVVKPSYGLAVDSDGIYLNTNQIDSSPTLVSTLTTDRYYKVQLTNSGTPFVSVPWANYTFSDSFENSNNAISLKEATTSLLGGIKLGDVTVLAINSSNKVYGVGKTSDGQLAVSVPWESGTGGITYTFEDGTNGFFVTPSGGSRTKINVTPSIQNNVTYSTATKNRVVVFNNASGEITASNKTIADLDDNDFHTPDYSSGLKIATGYGVNDLYIPLGSTNTTVCVGNDPRLSDSRTPTAHASSATTYGIGTTSNYGHVKLATGDMNNASNEDGVACSKNHTHSQYLTSFTESDPVFVGSPAHGIEATDITNWNAKLSAVPKNYSVLEGTSTSAYGFNQNPTILSLTLRKDANTNKTTTLSCITNTSNVALFKVNTGMSIGGDVTLTSGKFYDSSDIRLKRKIKELVSVLDCIEDIPIVQYEYKSEEDHKYIGTLAQKLLPLFPELVNQDTEGYYSVDYGGLAAIAVQGLKELYREIKDIKRSLYGDQC